MLSRPGTSTLGSERTLYGSLAARYGEPALVEDCTKKVHHTPVVVE